MITVRVFGLLRLDSGISWLELEGGTVGEILERLPEALDKKKIGRYTLLVNGKPANVKTGLKDGDELYILSPVAGG